MFVAEKVHTPYEALLASPGDFEATALGDTLFAEYAGSRYGHWHARQPLRYGDFAYGPREQMLADIGRDIDPLLHMPATGQTFLKIAGEQPDDWSPAEIRRGYAASMVHDIGENTHWLVRLACRGAVGDIAQGCKTPAHKIKEAKVRSFLQRRLWPSLADEWLEGFEPLIAHTEDSHVHHTNEAAHDTNTYLATLRASEVRFGLPVEDTSRRAMQLQRMGRVGSADILGKMEKHAKTFRLPALVLDATRVQYDRIQEELKP